MIGECYGYQKARCTCESPRQEAGEGPRKEEVLNP